MISAVAKAHVYNGWRNQSSTNMDRRAACHVDCATDRRECTFASLNRALQSHYS